MSGCSCNSPGDIRFIVVNGQRTGITGLLDVFELWMAEDLQHSALSDEDIISEVRKFNYISESAEAEYIDAVRREYAMYRKKDGKESAPS